MCRTKGFAVLVAGLIGCGPGKQLPDAAVKPSAPPVEPALRIPTKSDAAAKAVVDAALRATSGGQVARIETVKAFRSSAKGVMRRPVGGQLLDLDTSREFEAVWPNACRLRLDSQSLKPFTVGLNRPAVWVREGDEVQPIPDARRAEEIAATDTLGRDWLMYLVPLYDPAVVAFDASTTTVAGKTFDTVKVSVPGYPLFVLSFNDGHLLTRVEYLYVENGASVTTVLLPAEHKPFDGILLPTKIEYVRNGQLVEQWNVTKWEVVEKMDESIFDMPK